MLLMSEAIMGRLVPTVISKWKLMSGISISRTTVKWKLLHPSRVEMIAGLQIVGFN